MNQIAKESFSYEQRDVAAMRTQIPEHHHMLNAISKLFGTSANADVGTACDSAYPADLYETIDHILISPCRGCGVTFIWADRTQQWTQT